MNINATLFGQIITFAVFVWFCMKFVWPPILAAMAEREKKISDGLAAADRAAKDLDLAKEKATEQLREAKGQAAEIIEQARKRADQMIDEAKNQAREEGDRIKKAAQAEIDQQVNRAKEDLRAKLAGLTIAGAERILEASVDQSSHSKMLEKLAAEL